MIPPSGEGSFDRNSALKGKILLMGLHEDIECTSLPELDIPRSQPRVGQPNEFGNSQFQIRSIFSV